MGTRAAERVKRRRRSMRDARTRTLEADGEQSTLVPTSRIAPYSDVVVVHEPPASLDEIQAAAEPEPSAGTGVVVEYQSVAPPPSTGNTTSDQ